MVNPEDEDDNSVNITGLTFGEKYDIVVVARDGAGKEEESKPVTVTLGTNPGQCRRRHRRELPSVHENSRVFTRRVCCVRRACAAKATPRGVS